LAPEKGYDVLIRAMTELPGCCLVLLGEGPERARLTKLARQLGVEDRVELAGWIPSPWTDHFRFDVIAVPSSFEGFGLVAVEALLAGIPVVASRVGGLAEIVHDGETGLLVEPGDPSALAHALRELLIDPARRDVMGRRGRDDALQRFTPAAMASAYEAFLSSAISGHSRHPLSRR
jgi:glycosyltransferase involved in cell wall biosynthesis